MLEIRSVDLCLIDTWNYFLSIHFLERNLIFYSILKLLFSGREEVAEHTKFFDFKIFIA